MDHTDRTIVRDYLMRGQQHFITKKKGDGRIEIPRLVIAEMGWDQEEVHVFGWPGSGEAISVNRTADPGGGHYFGRIVISFGRIRIPLTMLNKAGFRGDLFSVGKEGRDRLVVRPYSHDRGEELDRFVDTLEPLQMRMLSNFILGRSVDTDAEQVASAAAKPLFLVSRSNTVFKTIGPPFRFSGIYLFETGEIVDTTSNRMNVRGHTLYAVPGIRRANGNNDVGFLIVNDRTFGAIVGAVHNHGNTPPDVELLFMYDNRSDSMYRVFVHPPSDVFNDCIESARRLCADPGAFISGHFRKLVAEPAHLPEEPPVFTDANVLIVRR